ncbi:hypothetical protein RQP46_008495 [Phenoliferia psychrophenolica]
MSSFPSHGDSDLKDAVTSGLVTPQLNYPRTYKGLKARMRTVRNATHCHRVAATMFGMFTTLLVCCVAAFIAYRADVYKPRFTLPVDIDHLGIFLEGQVTAIDADAGSFSITWNPGFSCGSPDLFTNVSTIGVENIVCGFPKVDFNVYIQENASSLYAGTWTAGQFAAVSSDFFGQLGKMEFPRAASDQSFQTDIDFDLSRQLAQYKRATPLAYPFDKYKSYITFLVARADNNDTLPIVGVVAEGAIPNWSISSKGYQLTRCTSFTMDDPDSLAATCTATEDDTVLKRYVVELSAQRTKSVVAFVTLIWLTNWIITLVIIWTTTRVVCFGANLPSDLILVPITALFSIPAVRGTMPGAPDFGSYMDVCGFLFNLTLISICSALVLVVGIKRNFQAVE